MAETLVIQMIDSLPAAVRRAIDGVSTRQLQLRPAAGEWSMIEVIGHLIDHTSIWGERCRRIALEDHPKLPAFDQEAYVRDRHYQEQDAQQLVKQLSAIAVSVAGELRSLPEIAWSRYGTHQERGELTLAEASRIFAIGLPEHVLQLVAAREAAFAAEPSAHPATES